MAVLGFGLLLLPFAVMTFFMVKEAGWKVAVVVWGAISGLIGCIIGGILALSSAGILP